MKTNIFLIYFFVLSLTSIPICKSQTPEKNLLKYWYYRDRLVNNFMTCICDENGGSIPASIRNNRSIPPNLSWGDATIQLAYYIGTLALEHYLLNSCGESTDETDKELFYAMNAVNRLDLNGNYLLDEQEAWPNGFIIRDDVGLDIGVNPISAAAIRNEINSHPSGSFSLIGNVNNPSILSDALNSIYHKELIADAIQQWNANPGDIFAQIQLLNFLASEFVKVADDAESKDQIIHLMVGLSLVIKILPPNLVYHENGGVKSFYCCPVQTSFVSEAKDIIDRLVYRIHNDNTWWHWVIKIPNTDYEVPRGGGANELSFGFRDAQFELTGNPNTCTSNPIDQALRAGLGDVWEGINTFSAAVASNGEFSKVADLCAIYNRWNPNHSRGCAVGIYDFSYIPLFKKALYPGDDLQIFQGQYDRGPLDARNYLENLLNDAPCYGPFNYSSNPPPVLLGSLNEDYPSYEWSSNSRLIHPESRGNHFAYQQTIEGDYNGIDYMFYYNLYRYVFRNDLKKSFNKLTRSEEITDYPFFNSYSPSTGFGSHDSPIAIESFNTIEASNKIHSDGDVTYRATESITILPGFQIDNGADFYAYIDPIECNAPDGNIFERKPNSAGYTDNSISPPLVKTKTTSQTNAGIYPNPVLTTFSLNIDLQQDQKIHAELKDAFGNQVMAPVIFEGKKGGNEMNFGSIENLTNGVYLLYVTTESIQKTIKVIKSN